MEFAWVLQRVEQGVKRVTPQRQEVLRVLVEHADAPLSAEEIFQLVRTQSGIGGLATIYRTLDLLVQLKVLRRLVLGDGAARFELDWDTLKGQRQMVCNRCGQVEYCAADVMRDVEGWMLREHGFQVDTHDVKLYGVCQACLAPGSDTVAG